MYGVYGTVYNICSAWFLDIRIYQLVYSVASYVAKLHVLQTLIV